MLHFWRSKEDVEMGRSALGDGATGDISVVLGGNKLDANLVYLGCRIAREAKRKVHLLHVIEVSRALPLNAILTQESERADAFLHSAMHIAEKAGCKARAEVVHAHDAGSAIIAEAKDRRCALILMGLIRNKMYRLPDELGKTASYVLVNAPCRVWFVQEPQ